MTVTKTATRTPNRPTRAEAARKHAQEVADRVAKMSPATLRKMLADCTKTLNKSAPTMEAASSDLLVTFMAVGLEFVKRFYPTANQASFHISSYQKHDHDWSAHIAFPIPEATADAEKGGVA